MPGTLTVRPLTANLSRDTEIFGTMDPYCKITLGNQKITGEVCRNGGKHPSWEDTLVLKRKNEPTCHVEIKEKDWLLPDGVIGSCEVNLQEVEAKQRVLKWYPILYENKPAGKILLEINWDPEVTEVRRNVQPNNAVLTERVNQNQNQQIKPQEQQQQQKKGFFEGIIHGWTPFGSSKSQQQPVDAPKKQEIPAAPVQPVQQVQQTHVSYVPSNIYMPPTTYDHDTYMQQDQVYQGNNWVAPQQENSYPQKYPSFSPQQSMNIDSNYRDAYYQDSNMGYVQPVGGDQHLENREVYDYRRNQENEPSGSGQYLNDYYGGYNSQQENQVQPSNKFDPLRVIRGM